MAADDRRLDALSPWRIQIGLLLVRTDVCVTHLWSRCLEALSTRYPHL